MGIFIVPLLCLYYIVTFWFVCKVSFWGYSRSVKKIHVAIRFIMLSFIFYGSELYSYAEWKVACATTAGLHVYGKESVDGFFYPGIGEIESRYFLNHGYSFIEGLELIGLKPATDQIYRFYKDLSGFIYKEAVHKLGSKYQYQSQQIKMLGGGKIEKDVVRNIDTGAVLGESVVVQYSGGLIQDLLFAFFSADQVGRSAQCSGNSNRKNIIEEVIPPLFK
ncbi:hypothetical protein [Pseudomonas syringae]|uniref:hypothetical protein n=1 Tax=Pseudomonas syringae TaxID=317 RepID=UPI0032AFDCF3